MTPEEASVLVVDDDAAVGKVLTALLLQNGFETHHAASAEEALRVLESRSFDAVISDVRMPGIDGIALVREIGRRHPGLPVVLLTAHGSIPMAVEAMKAGAIDFISKPFHREEILFVLGKALARVPADHAPPLDIPAPGLLGSSPAWAQVVATIRKVAAGTATVLVRGETGTGKELVARALHETGPRKAQSFVRVHCAALPDSLLESELFGHEKGAFTGAVARKPGRVELAHRGTLFLDEIGDIAPHVQVKLLRVLQERELERVGGTQTLKVDVRVVAATHRDLEAMVAEGTFREDLFYRLNVVPIRVPPLRDRGADVEILAKHFTRAFGEANGKPRIALEPGAVEVLRRHHWPGNVRELQNVVERLVVLADGPTVRPVDVERELSPRAHGGTTDRSSAPGSLDESRRDAEKAALTQALVRSGNNRSLAARLLNVSRRTLYNKLKEHGLS